MASVYLGMTGKGGGDVATFRGRFIAWICLGDRALYLNEHLTPRIFHVVFQACTSVAGEENCHCPKRVNVLKKSSG